MSISFVSSNAPEDEKKLFWTKVCHWWNSPLLGILARTRTPLQDISDMFYTSVIIYYTSTAEISKLRCTSDFSYMVRRSMCTNAGVLYGFIGNHAEWVLVEILVLQALTFQSGTDGCDAEPTISYGGQTSKTCPDVRELSENNGSLAALPRSGRGP